MRIHGSKFSLWPRTRSGSDGLEGQGRIRVRGWVVRQAVALLIVAAWLGEHPAPSVQAGIAGAEEALSQEAADSAAAKLRRIEDASIRGRSFGTVRITEREANSYLHRELSASFPPGVSEGRLQFQPDRPIGSAVIDFDRMKEALRAPPHPIADILLRGVHTLAVEGTLSGAEGTAEFHPETVMLDGLTLPRPVVEFLIEHYLKVRYPTVALDRPFPLPLSIDRVSVEAGSVVLADKPAR